MAKQKSKKANKSSKSTTTTTVKEAKEVKKVDAPKDTKDVKDTKVEKDTSASKVVEAKVVTTETSAEPEKKISLKESFFGRKCDPSENILTIFKSPRIWGAIIGELVGTMLLTMLLLTIGAYQPLYIFLGMVGITVAVVKLSGAHLNPAITVGMMASRRVSVIRGVVYILAQIAGAFFGMLLTNGFRLAGDGTAELTTMAEVAPEQFWVVTLIEFVGATILAFFFARALSEKRHSLAFAVTVASGLTVALLFVIVVSSNFLGLQNNFMMNPAVALMYQILPTGGDNFGALLGDIALALVTYVIFPMLGGVLGFCIADVARVLSGEPACHGKCCEHKDCNCNK